MRRHKSRGTYGGSAAETALQGRQHHTLAKDSNVISLPDIKDGPELFEKAFGPRFGPWWWRVVLVVVTLAIVCVALGSITGFGKQIAAVFGLSHEPVTSAPPDTHADRSGAVINNEGIFTQGQRGDNSINK